MLSQRSEHDGRLHPCAFLSKYLQTAKCLNSRQAWWALFFNRFNFRLSFRPGSKNLKPDALSQIHSPNPSPEVPENILPHSCLLGAVSWEIEDQVKHTMEEASIPRGCPTNRLFVSLDLRSAVIQWAQFCRATQE